MRLPDRENSRAVLIGVGAYQRLPALRGVHNGASALRQVLVDPRYGSLKPDHCVLVPERAAREDVGRAILRAAAEAEDMLLLYFAGHGLKGARRHDLHLAVADTDIENVTFTGIKYDDVRDILLNSNARSKVVILDCCLSGRALSQRMAAADGIIDEVEIEGVATLTSVPPNHDSIILPGENYPAYTGRLLKLLRDGIPDAPELLNLPVLHRSLHKALKAAGLRQPQANFDALLDGLGLVRNRARAEPKPEPPKRKPGPPRRPVSATVSPDAARPLTTRAAKTYPRPSEAHDQAARVQAASTSPSRVEPKRSPRELLRAVLTAGLALTLGSLIAFGILAWYHSILPESAGSVLDREMGNSSGYIIAGVVFIAIAGLFGFITQSGPPSVRTPIIAFVAGLLVGFGALLAFGLEPGPVVIGIPVTGAYLVFVRALRRFLVRRAARVGGPA